MKRIVLLLFLFGFGAIPRISAQVVGDEALQKLQSGEVSFLDGEFIVFLNDTVSPHFIEQAFLDLKYEISYSDINPILISIVNSPADSTIEELKNHPDVQRLFYEPAPVDSAYFKELLEQRGLSGENFDRAYDRLITSQTRDETLFEFTYSVNEDRLKQIMGNFRSVAYQILQNYPRSVNVTCTPGEEQELMGKIEQLPFVESTALIGVIGN
ncbi:MAG: hypothetical protein BalsKO_28420 [Balneolaceae bacterium]